MLEKGLTLALAVPAIPILLQADEARLAQALANLLSNAAKHTLAGGSVTLAVHRGDGQVMIKVRDTGAGIEPNLLESIFDPFVQAKQSLARTEGGLGLGLTVVKGIVELHGGTVSVTSTLGSGTVFTLALPDATRHKYVPAGIDVSKPAETCRVLVVDDNRDAADSFAAFVRMLGHEVDVAYDGRSAVASALARRPSVVLCDIGLPGMSGYDVARALRTTLGDSLRLVAVSGYAQPEDVEDALAAGFEAHVAKPPDLTRVEHLLSSFAASV
jgi:CheY-like chemotaxis protein/anti-sigma regulatory factor (Ser/Thr protein kinase)